jgi:hypothetical protein
MLLHRKAEPLRRASAATALDAGATIQDAFVRRLRLARSVAPDAKPAPAVDDRAPIGSVVGRRR